LGIKQKILYMSRHCNCWVVLIKRQQETWSHNLWVVIAKQKESCCVCCWIQNTWVHLRCCSCWDVSQFCSQSSGDSIEVEGQGIVTSPRSTKTKCAIVGTLSCLKLEVVIAGMSFGTESCMKAEMSFGTKTENRSKLDLSFVSDFRGFV
jgi:hypothetical protein